MKSNTPTFLRRLMSLAVAAILMVVLAACTGRGGGYLPPDNVLFKGQASFGFTFRCEDGDLHIELSYTDKGSNPIGSSFGIHGFVDTIDPVLESQICIGENPPQPENQLIFLGRYRLTSGAPGLFPRSSCPTQETPTSPLCRFEVIVHDNDRSMTPSPGDFFSIKLSTVTATVTEDYPPGGIPPCVITEFPAATVFYARAGNLAGGNLTVD
jgi:hypothetical protein